MPKRQLVFGGPVDGAQPWRHDAACRDTDTGTFFPEDSYKARIYDESAAKALCAVCPVSEPCLEFALRNNERFGVWGGLNKEERARVRRQRRVAGVQAAKVEARRTEARALAGQGRSVGEIAEALHVDSSTVNAYLRE